jgi:hypothetical protein
VYSHEAGTGGEVASQEGQARSTRTRIKLAPNDEALLAFTVVIGDRVIGCCYKKQKKGREKGLPLRETMCCSLELPADAGGNYAPAPGGCWLAGFGEEEEEEQWH